MLIGFKRAMIQPLDNTGKATGEVITLEGTQDEGATQEANISGLSSDPVKVYGSNIAYYVSQKGTGDVSIELKLLDMPSTSEDIILGYKTDSTLQAQLIGEDTEPPYCALILESADAQGNVALFGFFKGKFNKSEISLATKEGENFEPDGETYTFSAVSSDKDDASKGNTMIKYLGDEANATAVRTLTLGLSA